jgi:hypothetical protein
MVSKRARPLEFLMMIVPFALHASIDFVAPCTSMSPLKVFARTFATPVMLMSPVLPLIWMVLPCGTSSSRLPELLHRPGRAGAA